MVAVMSVAPALFVVMEGIEEPLPFVSETPLPVTVQLYVTLLPAKLPASCAGVNEGMVMPVHTEVSLIGEPVIVGNTVMVNAVAAPVHATLLLVQVGITETFPVTGTLGSLVFVEVNVGSVPVADAPNPIAVLSFVHAQEILEGGAVTKLILFTVLPLQQILFPTGLMEGIGLTVMVTTDEYPEQGPLDVFLLK